jgi:sarcosine oxidase subunit beta
MHYDLEPESALAWSSYQIFRNWSEIVGGECGFTRTGFLQFVAPDHAPQLRANVAMHQRLGIPSLVVTADDVRRLAPAFYTDDFGEAAYEPESGYADPTGSAAALLTAARAGGARLVQDEGHVDHDPRRACHRRGDQRREYDAPIVVNAAGRGRPKSGGWRASIFRSTTWRHDTAFLRRPPDLGPSHPTVIDFINLMYFRPETGGLTLVGQTAIRWGCRQTRAGIRPSRISSSAPSSESADASPGWTAARCRAPPPAMTG